MCGIAGFCDFTKKSDKKTLVIMTDVLHHRGPDDSGYSFYENEYATIGLGHRRLSILDLSSHGHQPMEFEHLEIVYNGEVYNFKEIREELIKDGYTFHSDSDTEVILKAYYKWGIKAVNRFNGMFAIAFYDKSQDKLTLIRDRAGVKPLYYYFDENIFMFSSELKSFHQNSYFVKNKTISNDGLQSFLLYGSIKAPLTIFENCYKLLPGEYLEFNIKTKDIKKSIYWNTKKSIDKNKSYEEYKQELEELLKSACEYRMIADVPVGVFLSGGIDSSLVCGILSQNHKLKTFTIGMEDEKLNEAKEAKQIANHLDTEHRELYIKSDDFLDIIKNLPNLYDEPLADESAIPTTLLSKFTKEYVTVSLSADGGDELFGGYTKYPRILKEYSYLKYIPSWSRHVLKLFGKENHKLYDFLTLQKSKKTIVNLLDIKNRKISEYELSSLLKNKVSDESIDNHNYEDKLSDVLHYDYKHNMQDAIVTKVERATMSVSLEGREPLLDYRLFEFAQNLPDEYKINGDIGKYILKDIAYKYVPKEILDRPKKGFTPPLKEWLEHNEVKTMCEKYFSKEFLKEQNIFDVSTFQKIANKNIRMKYNLLVFQMWFDRWMR